MWLLRWRTGLAMTVLVGAMQADSRGSVVGRGSGDCSCLTVVSYGVRQKCRFASGKERLFCINPVEAHNIHMCVCECVCVPAGSPAEGTEAPCEQR